MNECSDLSMYAIDDLVAELRRRSAASLVVLLHNRLDSEGLQILFSGSRFTAIGLAEHTKDVLRKKLVDAVEPASFDDIAPPTVDNHG